MIEKGEIDDEDGEFLFEKCELNIETVIKYGFE